MQQKHLILLAVGFIASIALLVGIYATTRPRAYIQLQTAPNQVTVEYENNSDTVTSGSKLTVSPGSYIIKITADDFEATERTVTVSEDETATLYVALTPKNDSARSQLETAEAKKILAQQKALEREKLISLLPIYSETFDIQAVPALLHPNTDKIDIFINVKKEGGEEDAKANIRSLNLDIDMDAILVGTNSQYAIAREDEFEIKAMFDKSSPDEPLIYITPLGVPFVPREIANNPRLESIKERALTTLDSLGYHTDEYEIYYADPYLSKYSPTIHDHATHAQAHPE